MYVICCPYRLGECSQYEVRDNAELGGCTFRDENQ